MTQIKNLEIHSTESDCEKTVSYFPQSVEIRHVVDIGDFILIYNNTSPFMLISLQRFGDFKLKSFEKAFFSCSTQAY